MNILNIRKKQIVKLKSVFIFLQILLIIHTNFLIIPHSFAAKNNTENKKRPLILAYSATDADYQGFLHFSKSFYSFSQEYLNKQNLNTKKLQDQFKIAQDLYFQGKTLQATDKFKNIIKQKWDNDWTVKQKNWIYFSFLRLSQISDDFRIKHLLIKEAISFAPEKRPNYKVFSPPFLKLYNKLHANIQWSYINNYLKIQNYKKIIINGKVFDIKPDIKIPVNSLKKFRLSLLSNKVEVYSKITDYHSFSTDNILQKPLVTGTCKKFKNHSAYKYSIFFTNSCIKNNKKVTKHTKSDIKISEINLFPKQNLTPLKKKKEKLITIKKSTWILVGLAIVGTAILTSRLSRRPTHKIGFDD